MKLYHHILIIFILVLLTALFYKNGFGFIPFLLATVYLAISFIREIKRLD